MFAVITRADKWNDIKTAAAALDEDIIYKVIGDDIYVREAFDELLRLEIVKKIIIDISCFVDVDQLPVYIRKLRIYNDCAQIIILAPECQPGNPVIAELVTIGVYDIINSMDGLKDRITEVINKPTKYAKAVRWDTSYRGPQNELFVSASSKVEVKNIILNRERIVGTVTIAVAGAIPRIGTTHFAITLATYIRDLGHTVAILELNKNDHFKYIADAYFDTKNYEDHFVLDSIVFYPNVNITDLPEILAKEYQYIIMDLGVYNACDQTEFLRAHKRIIVSGTKDWELPALEVILEAGQTVFMNHYVFNFTDLKGFNEIKQNMDQLKCYHGPYEPDPFRFSMQQKEIIEDILKGVLPETKKQVSKEAAFPSILPRIKLFKKERSIEK